MVEQLLLIISILSIELYVWLVKVLNGDKLSSISDSWYMLSQKGYKKKWFTFALWGLTIPISYLAANNEKWFMLAGASLIMLVGVVPAFKLNKYENTVHMVGAFGGSILSMLSIFFDYGNWHWPCVTICIIIASIVKISTSKGLKLTWRPNKVWIVETIIIRSVYLFLFIDSVHYYIFKNI